jgi:iron complex outermembrane receptor protein
VVLLLWAGLAQARMDTLEDEFALLEEELAADEVKSASKHRQSIFWSPSAITVFTREDIQNSSAATLTDLLRRVPGFDVYEVKSSNPLVGARALTEDSNNLVLLLVDGREAMVEVTGFAYWSGLTIDLPEIERIEVIRGPGSTLYGANAFAAVVNITTVADRPASGGEICLAGGEEGFYNLFGWVREHFDLHGGTLSAGITLGAEKKRSPSDSEDVILQGLRSHGYLRYQKGRELDLSLHAGVVDGGELNYVHMGDLRLTDAVNYWVMAKAEFALGEGHRLKAQVYHSYYESVYKYRTSLRAYNMWIADLPDFPNHTPTVDAQVQLDNQIADGLLLISGANLRYTTMISENFTPDEIDELRGAVFTHAQWNLHDNLQLTGGLRLDFNSETDLALSPRAVVVFRPWLDHAFRLGYGLAFRKPSFFEAQLHVKIDSFNPATPEIVEQMATQLGNEGLVNEKVHSIEAGWRAHLLDGQLQASVDLFFNIYRDTIFFLMDVPFRLGLPDIANSTFRYETQDEDILALGGEAELTARPHPDWLFWVNLGLRRVSVDEFSEHLASEPVVRANLGGRYLPDTGLLLDLAVHYVSEYEMPLRDPSNLLDKPKFMALGNEFLLMGRLGFQLKLDEQHKMEAGLSIRMPLGTPFREYAGVPFPEFMRSDSDADFGGELLVRRLSFYLRGTL